MSLPRGKQCEGPVKDRPLWVRQHRSAGVCFNCPSLAAAAQTPPAPDYANPESWAARPSDTPGHEEDTPAGVAKGILGQRNAVDVFFIHPTTYLRLSVGNAHYDESGATRLMLENGV